MSDTSTDDHIRNLARQAEYRDTTTLRLTKQSQLMHRRAHCKTSPSHRSIRSTREDRRQINRMAHPVPGDLNNADGVEDPDCADVTNAQPETVIATSALKDTLRKYATKIVQEESTSDSHCTSLKMTNVTTMKMMMLRQYIISKPCAT